MARFLRHGHSLRSHTLERVERVEMVIASHGSAEALLTSCKSRTLGEVDVSIVDSFVNSAR